MQKRNLGHSYTLFKKENKELAEKVSKTIYIQVNYLFLKFLIKKVLEGHRVTLPARLGILSIVGKKRKPKFNEKGEIINLPPNWAKTFQLRNRSEKAKKEKKIVYCTNEHSDNISYRYYWQKKMILVKNKSLYSLKMSRANKRAVSALIKNGKEY